MLTWPNPASADFQNTVAGTETAKNVHVHVAVILAAAVVNRG
jgi:hypothetical protein